MKKIHLFVLTTMVIAGLLGSACGTPQNAATEVPSELPPTPAFTEEPPAPTEPVADQVVLVDGLGREVTLDQPPQRIVSLAPSATETLFAIGAGELLVGRDDFSDYPEQAAQVPSIGSTYGELNTEAILGLEPDLVLGAGITPPEQIATLEELGIPVFVIGNPEDFPGLFENLLVVGELVGHSEGAEQLVQDMRARYEAVLELTSRVEPISLFYEIDASDPQAPYTTGSGTFQNLLIELAGGENIAADIEGWGQLSLEEIVVRDPEVIVFGSGPFVPTTVEALKERAGWEQLSAVQNDHVYAIDTDLLDLVGPRLVDGLEALAQVLHPELFGE